jgi:hypothetical protein
MNLRQKLALHSVVLLGLLVCLLSVVRFWDITQQYTRPDYSYQQPQTLGLTSDLKSFFVGLDRTQSEQFCLTHQATI